MNDIRLVGYGGIREFIAEASRNPDASGLGFYRDSVRIEYLSLDDAKKLYPSSDLLSPSNPGTDAVPS